MELYLLVLFAMTLPVAALGVLLVWSWYRSVGPGEALVVVRSGQAEPAVRFTGALVLPMMQRAERLDLTARVVRVERRGAEGLLTKGRERVDIVAAFTLRVPRATDDVARVAQRIGCARANDLEAIAELFSPRFVDALESVAQRLEPDALFAQRDAYRDSVLQYIGRDLDGFILDEVAVELLERTPSRDLDPRREGFRRAASV